MNCFDKILSHKMRTHFIIGLAAVFYIGVETCLTVIVINSLEDKRPDSVAVKCIAIRFIIAVHFYFVVTFKYRLKSIKETDRLVLNSR